MVQSPSWETNWFAASQKIPRISRNPKVHYRTHKRPPPVSILGQPNPVHIPTSHLLEIRPNIHPSTPRFPQWSRSLRFSLQDPTHTPLPTHTRLIPSPSQENSSITTQNVQLPSWLYNLVQSCLNNVGLIGVFPVFLPEINVNLPLQCSFRALWRSKKLT